LLLLLACEPSDPGDPLDLSAGRSSLSGTWVATNTTTALSGSSSMSAGQVATIHLTVTEDARQRLEDIRDGAALLERILGTL
jgi:hypothetical protein